MYRRDIYLVWIEVIGDMIMIISTKQKRMSYIVFTVNLILLAWLILFKFATNFSEIPSMRSINLIPFHYIQETSMHLKEVLYNIIVFVPLGVYVQIFKDNWKLPARCFVILGTSLFFEIIQFIFAIGASDVTDLIGNTFGGIIGILFCSVMRKIAAKKFISKINVCGLMIEFVAIALLSLLLVANS